MIAVGYKKGRGQGDMAKGDENFDTLSGPLFEKFLRIIPQKVVAVSVQKGATRGQIAHHDRCKLFEFIRFTD
jgi:hypothetical protein